MWKWNLLPTTMILMTAIACMFSNHWIIMWLTLEVSTLGFILALCCSKKKEKILLFFLFQSFASMMMLVYLFFNESTLEQNIYKLSHMLVVVTVIMKTGMFPFHTWLMGMVKNINWNNITMLLTWQKMIPLFLLAMVIKKMNPFNVVITTMVVTTVIMMSISKMKKIMVTSSLIHNGWMMMSMVIFKTMFFFYMLVYSTILIMLNLLILKNNIKTISQQMKSKTLYMNKMILMFSMSGIPPSMGFLLKFSILLMLVKNNTHMNIIIILMVISSLSFLVYLKMFFKTFLLMKNNSKKPKNMKNKKSKILWLNVVTPTMLMK